MKGKTRELLVSLRATENWKSGFDSKVGELMDIVSKVDNSNQIASSTETIDVYKHKTHKSIGSKKSTLRNLTYLQNEQPFEFLIFRN